MVNVHQVYTTYGAEEILRGVDFEAAKGELVACVGPSGSGKTTLLNVIAGLLTPDEGQVEVAGVCLNGLTQQERATFRRERVGFIFQSFNLLPYLTAIENVEMPLYLAGVDRARQPERAEELLRRVGLNGKANRMPSQLSMGEQQRVAIARALVHQPRVLLADEPTGNLDRHTGSQVMDCIHAITEEGVTVVLVTHDSEIAGVAHRKVTIIDGRLQS